MKLNKKLEVGIKTIGFLKHRDGFVRTIEIAKAVGTTVSLLEQVMANLRSINAVSVKRGPGGGYAINRDVEVTAYMVAKAVGRFPDNLRDGDASLIAQLRRNIIEAFRSTRL